MTIPPIITNIPPKIRYILGFAAGLQFRYTTISLSSKLLKLTLVGYVISEIWDYTSIQLARRRGRRRRRRMSRLDEWMEGYKYCIRSTLTRPSFRLCFETNAGVLGFGSGTIAGLIF